MVLFPPCKINLGLRVLRRRSDGYHDIESCLYPVPWTDILELVPAEKLSFHATGLAMDVPADKNLCLKAYHLLNEKFGVPPARIHLHKILPMGAGLGGGSSDAVATLKALNEVFSLRLNADELKLLAVEIGSDCPFFVSALPQMAQGRGEQLSPARVSLKGIYMIVVKPDVSISTAQAYSWVRPADIGEPVASVLALPYGEWKASLVNDFEAPVFGRFPQLANIKQKLYECGAFYSSMSGSGSAMFGLFKEPVAFPPEWRGMTSWSGYLS
jgi:4-diphosphocytidyl-2-C-methyl-D-erythritol kinase